MNSVSIADYIPRKDTFSRDKKICKNPKGCRQIYFSLSSFERENLLSLNLTEADIEQVEKSDKCPACAIEQRFGILLEYDHYRIDNFTETITRLCGECKEKFQVSDLATLIAELQDNHISPVAKNHRVHALMHEASGKGRSKSCAIEQVERASKHCAECKIDLSRSQTLKKDKIVSTCLNELHILKRDAIKIYDQIHAGIDATCLTCGIFRVEKENT